MRSLSMKKKLYLSFACMWAIMIFFAVFRGQQLSTVMDRYNTAIGSILIRQQYIGHMITTLTRLRFDDIVSGALSDHPDLAANLADLAPDLALLMPERYVVILHRYLDRYEELALADPLMSRDEILAHVSIVNNIRYILDHHYIPAVNSGESGLSRSLLYGNQLADLAWDLRDKTFAFAAYVMETMEHYDGVEEDIFNIATVVGLSVAVSLAILLAGVLQKHQRQSEGKVRLAMEGAQAASVAKSNFIANASHEIRTPMNSIIGYAELAMEDAVTDIAKNYMDKIVDNAKWLLDNINEIIDFSNIESGDVILTPVPFDMSVVLDKGRLSVAAQFSDKDVELDIISDIPAGTRFMGDVVKLVRICVNLMSNAVKFTEYGRIVCSVTTLQTEDDRSAIRFEVSDTGIGIADEDLGKIFEPFVQVGVDSHKYDGTGLGLAIAKHFVEAMGGVIHVESSLGLGSKFYFDLTLPVINRGDAPPETAGAPVPPRPHFEGGEVLVVEDNQMNQDVLCEHLRRVGLVPIVANNGREGVDIVKERQKNGDAPFSLIFMDIHMPVLDGYEATTIIKALNTGTPVIVMTASIVSITPQSYRDFGFDGYVSKPFTATELYQVLNKHVNTAKKPPARGLADLEFRIKMLRQFVRSNENAYENISRAIREGDLTLAHRLAHSLKSNAGLINESALQKSAAELESALDKARRETNHIMPDAFVCTLIDTMKLKLEQTLQRVSLLMEEEPDHDNPEETNADDIRNLLSELEPLLARRNADALRYVAALKGIPGAQTLLEQIEAFEMKEALSTLHKLKNSLDV